MSENEKKSSARIAKEGIVEQLKEKFSKDPTGTVKGLVGDAADNDTISKIVDAVKSALSGGKLGAIGEKISGMIGGLFGKKDDAEDEKKDE